MGHQDPMKEQVRSPQLTDRPHCTGVTLVKDQDRLVSSNMSDGDVIPPSVPFTRGSKARASLPVGRSSGQTRERPFGVLFLQYGEETKQVWVPTEISSRDALRGLFVNAFPHQLTVKMLQSPNMAIYIKDTSHNVYYDLEDIRNITPNSCLKAYHKDPAHVFNRHARSVTTGGRISKEALYGSHSPVHTLSSLQGSMSPPMVRSMPSSPSRVAYGGVGKRGGSGGVWDPSSTLPRERLSGAGRSSAMSTSSAILERRDIKPDEDAGNSKSMALVVHGEGGPHYPDSYCSSLQDGTGGRQSIPSSQCSAPPALTTDMVEVGVLGIPGGLQQYRASIKPLMGYGESMEDQTHSLHRQKSKKYSVSQLPPMGTKTPSPSPHRVSDIRMTDGGQIIGGMGLVSPEKISPIRRSLRQDGSSSTVEIVSRSRGSGSSSSASSVFADSPLGQSERLFQSHMNASSAQSERIKAMEEQIASLAGLVHHALSIGPDAPGAKDAVSISLERKVINRHGVSSESQNPAALTDSFSSTPLALLAPPSNTGMQQRLVSAKRNVCELRLQLNQLRCLQLSNQETVSSMLRMAGQELVLLMCDRLAQFEEAAYRRRAEMEEERTHYLAAEERILTQLSELEDYVDHLQSSSASSTSQLRVTLRDVEEGAVNLRRVGEALAILKGEFPELQMKMRSVLRQEVEAVRFLKEEPLKMDSMLKRVKALTETLSSLRRCVSESAPSPKSAQLDPLEVVATDSGLSKIQSPQNSPKPQPRSSVRPPQLTPPLSGSQAEISLVGSDSPIVARRLKSMAPSVVQPSQQYPSVPLTPTHRHESPTVAKVSPRSREGSPALQRRAGLQESDVLDQPAPTPVQQAHSEMTVTTERQTQEGSLGGEASIRGQSSNCRAKQPASFDSSQSQPPSASKDFDQVLQEVQASLMESIPNLDVSEPKGNNSASQHTTLSALKSEQGAPLNLTLQGEQQALFSGIQEGTPFRHSDEVDSTDIKAPNTVPATVAASQLPAATVDIPSLPAPSAFRGTESSSRPQVEKPRRSSLDKEMKQSRDRLGKSPPPPPPRRIRAVSSGLAAGRLGEVVFTTRTEPVGAQDDDDKEKELPAVSQPKPPRQPPEVKPKPQMCTAAPLPGSTSAHAAVSAEKHEEEEEELQVTELTNKNHSSCGNKQNGERKERTFLNSQVANDLATCDQQSIPQLGFTNGCCLKPIMAARLKEHEEGGKNCLIENKVKKVIKEVPSCPTIDNVEISPLGTLQDVQSVQQDGPTPNQDKAMKTNELPSPVSQKENVNTSNQVKEFVGKVSSPTMPEKKVKFTTVVTLQNENIQESVRCPEHINEKAVKKPTERKSNVMVVVTLKGREKEWMSGDHLSALLPPVQQNTSLRSDQEFITSTPIMKPSPLPPIMTSNTKQWKLEDTELVSSNQSQCVEEGGSLSCDEADQGPPPPPPLIGKFSNRISKSRTTTQSKEENLAKINGSNIQSVSGDSTGKPTYVGHGFKDSNDEFGTKPIIVILNEPMDIQSAYKRLSTIFECEEDLDGILCPEGVSEEEKTKQKEEEQDLRKICITEITMGSSPTGKSQNSPQIQHGRPSTDSYSVPENQDQTNSHSLRKPETKRKFKFKFPKNRLAALSQAIRTGSNKTGKKTVEVVVSEEEVAMYDRPVKETKNQTKESPVFEMNTTEQFNLDKGSACDRDIRIPSYTNTSHSGSHNRIEELCKNTFDSMDSLEESIKQLEVSVESITAPSSSFESTDEAQLKRKIKQEQERSPSKRSATQITKGPNPPQSKRAKPLPPHGTERNTIKKQTSSNSSSSSAQRSHVRSRHASGSPEKTPKGQQQATHKRASQPRLVTTTR
ncbi:sickle tail protein-like [Archocentrus centrarchus]|uniref:sickle tail protein-like n=1 Tax=Archocentrus centrarchus TaxID=63155 RepID=UPI0011EA3CE8|nr:sickle tail protein-like [Archocentrus centrarchus]